MREDVALQHEPTSREFLEMTWPSLRGAPVVSEVPALDEPSTGGSAPDLAICEQADLSILEAGDGGIFNPDGTVDMVLIRPCNGGGPFQNIYPAEMLARDASKFGGLPMYDNHDSPAARKARQGLPRSVSELAGVVREAWWDADYSSSEDAAAGFDRGAVVGRCALTDAMEALVRRVPEVVKGSLNTQATGKRPGMRNGRKGWVVEGFVADPEDSSFDLVTKAGAGGRVAAVLEAAAEERDLRDGGGPVGLTLQEALQSDEVRGWLQEQIDRGVAEAVAGGRHEPEAGPETSVAPVLQDVQETPAWQQKLAQRGVDLTAFGVTSAEASEPEPDAPSNVVCETVRLESGQVVEAEFLETRGAPQWAEFMRLRGVSPETIRAMWRS